MDPQTLRPRPKPRPTACGQGTHRPVNPASSPTLCGRDCCGPGCTWRRRICRTRATPPIRVQCVRAPRRRVAVCRICAATKSSACGWGCVRWQSVHDAPDAEPVWPARRPDPQDRDGLHQTRRPAGRPTPSRHGKRFVPRSRVAPTAKAGKHVELLFMYRARAIPREFINYSLIPTLCRKAGVAGSDVRGNITSHRARATIASQLFNSREPMSLFELQAWLGPRFAGLDSALRGHHPDQARQGLYRRRILRTQPARDRSADRPGTP